MYTASRCFAVMLLCPFMGNATADLPSQVGFDPQVACTSPPYGLRLPSSLKDIYSLGKIQKIVDDAAEQYDGYSVTDREIFFEGMLLGVGVFSNDLDRIFMSGAEISDARWNRLLPFPIGASSATIRQRLGKPASETPTLAEYRGEADTLIFHFDRDRLVKVIYQCYTG